jgi:hypothetical protein
MAKRTANVKEKIDKPAPTAHVFRVILHVKPSPIDSEGRVASLIDEIELFVIAEDDAEAREKSITHAEAKVRFVRGLEEGYAFHRELLYFAEIEHVARVDVA